MDPRLKDIKDPENQYLGRAVRAVLESYTATISQFVVTAFSVQQWAEAICFPFGLEVGQPPPNTVEQFHSCDETERRDVQSALTDFKNIAHVFSTINTQGVIDLLESEDFNKAMVDLRNSRKGFAGSERRPWGTHFFWNEDQAIAAEESKAEYCTESLTNSSNCPIYLPATKTDDMEVTQRAKFNPFIKIQARQIVSSSTSVAVIMLPLHQRLSS